MKTRARNQVLTDAVAFQPLDQDGKLALVISPKLDASVYAYVDGVWQQAYKLASLQSPHVNRWKLLGDHLLYTKANNREAHICRISWRDIFADEECHSIGNNRFRLHFDVNETQQHILLVESLSAESNIIKMQW